MSWGGDVELEARDLPDWAEDQPLTWTISSGQGSILDLGGIKIRYIGPQWGPDVPTKTLIHLFAAEEIVGECTITLAMITVVVEPEPPTGLPTQLEPEPPTKEEDIVPTVDCGRDPENPDQPLKIRPTTTRAGPNQEVIIEIEKIFKVCEHGCYTWRIAYGGGMMLCACGRKAIYYTPSLNGRCEDNAMIELVYCERVIAKCYVTINTWGERQPAYALYDRMLHFYFGFWDKPWRELQEVPPPAGVTAPIFYLLDWAHIYDCNDELIVKKPYIDVACYCNYGGRPPRWIITVPYPGIPYQEYKSLAEIPMYKLNYLYRKDEDLRTDEMKVGGCCPAGLVGLAYLLE